MTRMEYLRLEAGWTVEELSERSGVSHTALSRMETGKSRGSKLGLAAIGRAFGVSIPASQALLEDVTAEEVA